MINLNYFLEKKIKHNILYIYNILIIFIIFNNNLYIILLLYI